MGSIRCGKKGKKKKKKKKLKKYSRLQMILPIELLLKIVDLCIQSDVNDNENILKWTRQVTTTQLLLLNRPIYNYIIQNSKFNRLRLWKLLCHIPKQNQPIQLAVGVSDDSWTIVDVDICNERIGTGEFESFLVLEETMKFYTKPKKWEKEYLLIRKNMGGRQVLFFELYEFLQDLHLFTKNNIMSIWLWKRCNTFFKKDILFNMTNNNDDGFFRPVLDTQQKSLMAWDRPTLKKKGLTESVMLYNTELFGRLL
ncbi:uncharacterized protein EV154DRAFT_517900 [Mucor mucedo]|uniref:uncharacterized protein n=1 Tax=Mucor mucedo TaxID=29922 RepID=UPI00221F7447|nr:uncharacterized protein EV154DRAFT_517900 [Mucor mucedo]KAI7888432.1 hypothetical protein EV154DRAFT_517900 [Mucor mucedo]